MQYLEVIEDMGIVGPIVYHPRYGPPRDRLQYSAAHTETHGQVLRQWWRLDLPTMGYESVPFRRQFAQEVRRCIDVCVVGA